MSKLLITLIRGYQNYLSPYIGGSCRFHPSCSEYAVLAIKKNGAIVGSGKTVVRILRCNPLNEGGIDFP